MDARRGTRLEKRDGDSDGDSDGGCGSGEEEMLSTTRGTQRLSRLEPKSAHRLFNAK